MPNTEGGEMPNTEGGEYQEREFERAIKSEIPPQYLNSKSLFKNYLRSFSKEELQTKFNTNVDSKQKFIESMEESRTKLKENE